VESQRAKRPGFAATRRMLRAGFALLLAGVAQVHAVEFSVDRWDIDDGLPVNGLTALHRDPGGYLWIATFDGLVRFDGRRFVVLDTHEALPTRRLIDLRRSGDGLLWILTEQHELARFDGQRFQRVTRAHGLPGARVRTIELDAAQRLWVATTDGVASWDGSRFQPAVSETEVGGVASSVHLDRDGDLWIGQYDGEALRVREGRVIARYRAPDGVSGSSIADIAQLPDGSMLLASRTGVLRVRDDAVELLPATRGRDCFALGVQRDGRILVRTNAGGLWLESVDDAVGRFEPGAPVAREGMVRIAPDGAEWTNAVHYLLRDGVRVFESDCPLRDLVLDGDGSVWIASACEGLVRLRPRQTDVLGAEGSARPTVRCGPRASPACDAGATAWWISNSRRAAGWTTPDASAASMRTCAAPCSSTTMAVCGSDSTVCAGSRARNASGRRTFRPACCWRKWPRSIAIVRARCGSEPRAHSGACGATVVTSGDRTQPAKPHSAPCAPSWNAATARSGSARSATDCGDTRPVTGSRSAGITV
jgi:hypothetical protein